MARIFFMAFEAAGQMNLVKKLRQAGHRIALSEPKYPGFYDLLKQQTPPPDVIIADCSLKPSHALESCNYIRSLQLHKTRPLILYNVKKEDESRARERVPQAIVLPDDRVEKRLTELGLGASQPPA